MLGKLHINNPGNIKQSTDLFTGEVRPSSDPVFKEFMDMASGYRAMFKILNTYRKKYSISTIHDIIHRWAPPFENDTTAYVNFVSGRIGYAVDQPLPEQQDVLIALAAAMSTHENGVEAKLSEVQAGWHFYQGGSVPGIVKAGLGDSTMGYIVAAVLGLGLVGAMIYPYLKRR